MTSPEKVDASHHPLALLLHCIECGQTFHPVEAQESFEKGAADHWGETQHQLYLLQVTPISSKKFWALKEAGRPEIR
jgi:hypothetical protein